MNRITDFKVELNSEALGGVAAKADDSSLAGGALMITPAIDEDYWILRVALGKNAVVAFPKFGVIGIGFQREEDWNTNLPATCEAESIASHIMHNKGDDNVPEADVVTAIEVLQQALRSMGLVRKA